jgi:TolB-like protein/tetratricopeptide (TPR) repeat protein/tRNA A-37 threonylcarbamoyl transferase component Bud32
VALHELAAHGPEPSLIAFLTAHGHTAAGTSHRRVLRWFGTPSASSTPTVELRDQLQRTLGDAYTIERELGGGGMSHVFVAEERALGRKVVVKILPPEAAAQVSIERFKREIMLAARLQHPHIVPLLTAGDSAGVPYFTMPFIEGESLRARLIQRGELPVSDAVRVLREIASALAYAHERGIIHRDIKPDNVLLSGGSAMVTDFGVAKALSASTIAEAGHVTSLGVALGTPAYMSPEQATADPAVDHRADIYSFGVLAYELLTGQPPFAGRTPQNVLAAQVAESPEPIGKRRSSLPPALSALVMRCLEKRPADRPQRAADIVHALDALTTPGGGMQPTAASSPIAARMPRVAGSRQMLVGAAVLLMIALGVTLARRGGGSGLVTRSVAVLPFENRSGDTTYDYFAEGMSDELRSDLTNSRGLVVKGRGSSIRFRGHDVDVHDAGMKLAVGAVVTGSVNRSGQRLHVTAELVNVADGNALWSRTYDARIADGAAVQDSLTRAITTELKVSLTPARADTVGHGGSRGTTNVEAYDLFMRATYAGDRSDFVHAIEFLNAAVTKDPNFARAYAHLVVLYALQPITGFGSRDSALVLARRSLARAIALDSTLLDVYVAKSWIQHVEWKFADAEETLTRAIAANPGNVDLHIDRGAALGHLGRVDAALAEVRRAKELDPLDVLSLGIVQYTLYVMRDYRAAIRETPGILELSAGESAITVYQTLGTAYLFAGEPDSAIAAFEKGVHLDPKLYGGRMFLVLGYAAAGRWKEAREQRTLLERETGGNSVNLQRAVVHEVFGQMDSAMVDLERAADAKEPLFLTFWVNCDPMFDALKKDPRFGALMKRVGVTVCPASGRWPITAPRAASAPTAR